MGNGCSRPTDRFSHYQKFHGKEKNKSPREKTAPKPDVSKKKTPDDFGGNINQKKVVETIKLYTSNLYYEHMKKQIALKKLIPENFDEGNSYYLELIEEIRLYLSEIIENSNLAGILESQVIKESKAILEEISEKIILKPSKFNTKDISARKCLHRTVLLLVELYHLIKFLKEEGIFQEGKWWRVPDPAYISQIRNEFCEFLENPNEKKKESDQKIEDSSDSDSSPKGNIIKEERLKKWQTLAKEKEDQEKEERKEAPQFERSSGTAKIPTFIKNLQKPELMNLSCSPRKADVHSDFSDIEKLLELTEQVAEPSNKISENMNKNSENLEKSPEFSVKNSETEAKSEIIKDLVNKKKNLQETEQEILKNSTGSEGTEPKSFVTNNPSPLSASLQTPNRNSGEDSDFKSKYREAQKLSKFLIKTPKHEPIEEDMNEDQISPFKVEKIKRDNTDSQKLSDDGTPILQVESDFLTEFIKEAKENIKEVIELLLIRENSIEGLMVAEKIEKESELIADSLGKMRNFEDFLCEIMNKPFTKEISEKLKINLEELKKIRAVINEKYSKTVGVTPSENTPTKKKIEKRPSLEMMTQFQQSLDNFKSKIRESMNSLSISKEAKNIVKKARNIEEIEKNFEVEMSKMRSIHRKDSFKSNSESIYTMLDEACQDIETLKKKDCFNKDIIDESMKKVENSQQNLKRFYEKLLDNHDQIIFEDVEKKESNLKVIRNTQDQLSILRDFLKETLEKKEN